jgi:hypothetical protein
VKRETTHLKIIFPILKAGLLLSNAPRPVSK